MDIERDADDDLENFERLPSGAVLDDPRDLRYLRNLRERATLNRPDTAEPSAELLADLQEQKAELIALLEESEARNRNQQIQIANFYKEDESNRKLYSREVQRLLDNVYYSSETAIRATSAYLMASDGGRWAKLKDVPSLTGVPLQTARDWLDGGAVRWGRRSGEPKGTVYVYLPDVFTQRALRDR